jgi:hypothetical protein
MGEYHINIALLLFNGEGLKYPKILAPLLFTLFPPQAKRGWSGEATTG